MFVHSEGSTFTAFSLEQVVTAVVAHDRIRIAVLDRFRRGSERAFEGRLDAETLQHRSNSEQEVCHDVVYVDVGHVPEPDPLGEGVLGEDDQRLVVEPPVCHGNGLGNLASRNDRAELPPCRNGHQNTRTGLATNSAPRKQPQPCE